MFEGFGDGGEMVLNQSRVGADTLAFRCEPWSSCARKEKLST